MNIIFVLLLCLGVFMMSKHFTHHLRDFQFLRNDRLIIQPEHGVPRNKFAKLLENNPKLQRDTLILQEKVQTNIKQDLLNYDKNSRIRLREVIYL